MSEARRTRRWRGVLVVVFGTVGLGLLGRRPGLLLLGTVGLVYAAYPWLTAAPAPSLSIDRRLNDTNPAPGDEFTVTTTIRNESWRPLFDVRIVDGVPAALPVTDGSPRLGTVLWPGRAASVEYTIAAREGRHAFDPATVVVRDASGEHERELSIGEDTAVDCRPSVDDAPVRTQTLAAAGEVASEQGGSGIEFYRTRAYRAGDPMTHVDWNRFAKTGTLTTVDFREERSAAVVVLVDARAVCYRGPADEPHGVARCVSAAQQLVDELLDERNRVGLAGLGREPCWFPPDTGRRHRTRAQRLLTDHAAFSLTPPAAEEVAESNVAESSSAAAEQLATIERRLADTTQVLFCTPLLDDAAVDVARRLDAAGHAVSVVSPDVTETGTAGRDLVGLERASRIAELRRATIPVVDWEREQRLAAALTGEVREVAQ